MSNIENDVLQSRTFSPTLHAETLAGPLQEPWVHANPALHRRRKRSVWHTGGRVHATLNHTSSVLPEAHLRLFDTDNEITVHEEESDVVAALLAPLGCNEIPKPSLPHEERMHHLYEALHLESLRPCAYLDEDLLPELAQQRVWRPHEKGIAVRLLQQLGADYGALHDLFLQHHSLYSHEFVRLVSRLIRRLETVGTVPKEWANEAPLGSAFQKGAASSAANKARVGEVESDLVSTWYELSAARPNSMQSLDYFAQDEVMHWALAHLFCAVDTASCGSITWSDMSVFLTDLLHAVSEPPPPQYRRYTPVQVNAPELKVSGIARASFSESLQRVLCMGHDNVCRIVDPSKLSRVIQTYPYHPSQGTVLDMHLMESSSGGYHYSRLATASADCTVRVYDLGSTLLQTSEVFPLTQTQLHYDSRLGILFCGGRDGKISLLSLPDTERRCCNVTHLTHHSNPVTSFISLPGSQLLSTALEPHISVSNLATLQVISTFKGHERGVFSTTHSPLYNLIGSAGYELDPFVWVTNVSTFKPFVLKSLEPHTARIAKVHMVSGTPEMISLDFKGTLKVWDIRMMSDVYSVQCCPRLLNKNIGVDSPERFRDFAYYSKERRILTAGGLVARMVRGVPRGGVHSVFSIQYEKLQVKEKGRTEEHEVVCVVVLPGKRAFLTASGTHCTLWGATGRREQTLFSCSNKISAMCTVREERVYTGLCDGVIVVNLVETGAEVVRLTHHRLSVTLLLWVPGDTEMVLSSEYYGHASFILNADATPDRISIEQPRVDNIKVDALTACCDCAEDNHLFIGEPSNTVSVWRGSGSSYQRLCTCVDFPSEALPVCITSFRYDTRIHFVVSDTCGGLHLWEASGAKVVSWVGHTPKGAATSPHCTALHYEPALCLLYCGDDRGYVSIVDLGPTLRYTEADARPAKQYHAVFDQPRRGHVSNGQSVDTRSASLRPVPLIINFWRAHSGVCTSLCCTPGTRCIVTASADCCVKFFSLWGRLLGVLSRKPAPAGDDNVADIFHKLKFGAAKGVRYLGTRGPLAGNLEGLLDWDYDPQADDSPHFTDSETTPTRPYEDVPLPWGSADFGRAGGFSDHLDIVCGLGKPARQESIADSVATSRHDTKEGGLMRSPTVRRDMGCDGRGRGDRGGGVHLAAKLRSPPLVMRFPLHREVKEVRAAGSAPTPTVVILSVAATTLIVTVSAKQGPQLSLKERRTELLHQVLQQLGSPRLRSDDVSVRTVADFQRKDPMNAHTTGVCNSFSRPTALVAHPQPDLLQQEKIEASQVVLKPWLKKALKSLGRVSTAQALPVFASPVVEEEEEEVAQLCLGEPQAKEVGCEEDDGVCVGLQLAARLARESKRPEAYTVPLRYGAFVLLVVGLVVPSVVLLEVLDRRRRFHKRFKAPSACHPLLRIQDEDHTPCPITVPKGRHAGDLPVCVKLPSRSKRKQT